MKLHFVSKTKFTIEGKMDGDRIKWTFKATRIPKGFKEHFTKRIG